MTDEFKDPSNIGELKKDMERLLESRAWRMVCEALQAQADNLQQEILFSPVDGEADLWKMERKKGQLEGRLALAATAQAMMEGLELDYQQALAMKGNEE